MRSSKALTRQSVSDYGMHRDAPSHQTTEIIVTSFKVVIFAGVTLQIKKAAHVAKR